MFTNPIQNLKSFGIRETDVVVDLGAGTGFYALNISPLVPFGKVYAIDIHEDYLKKIKNEAKEKHLKNIECLLGDIEKPGGTKLGNEISDKLIISNVLSQMEDQKKFIAEASRILKKGGKIMFIDWSDSSPLFPLKHAISKDSAQKLFEGLGFVLDRDIDAGAHHYGMILSKQ